VDETGNVGGWYCRDFGSRNQRENASLLADGESPRRQRAMNHTHGRGASRIRFQFERKGGSAIVDREHVNRPSAPIIYTSTRSSDGLTLQRGTRRDEHALAAGALRQIDHVERSVSVPPRAQYRAELDRGWIDRVAN